jgi:DNA-directed RNA polymerase specialized sigma24 family protein
MHVRLMAVPSVPGVEALPARMVTRTVQIEKWRRRSETWGRLMAAAQDGDSRAYAQLIRELDAWLRRYYARRLPHPVSEDAKQEALLAIHAKRHTFHSARSFGAWVAAIARYKWVDGVRDVSRYSTISCNGVVPIEAGWDSATSAIAVDELLRRLTPAQARAIRLVKLEGASIEGAASTSGQSASLVKVNIHRGLKRLATFIAAEDATSAASAGGISGTACRQEEHGR